MRKLTLAMTALLMALALPMLAQAQLSVFDFNGQALVPDTDGNLTLYAEMFDPAPSPMPLPLDFANFEYTLVIDDMVLDTVSGFTETWINGMITIYEDAGTPADFAFPSTFSDGAVVLSGVVTTCTRTVFPMSGGGVGAGSIDWTGGDRLFELSPEDRLSWNLVYSLNFAAALAGYDEEWDGKTDVVADQNMTWGQVKSLY